MKLLVVVVLLPRGDRDDDTRIGVSGRSGSTVPAVGAWDGIAISNICSGSRI